MLEVELGSKTHDSTPPLLLYLTKAGRTPSLATSFLLISMHRQEERFRITSSASSSLMVTTATTAQSLSATQWRITLSLSVTQHTPRRFYKVLMLSFSW